MLQIIIAGSRDFHDYAFVERVLMTYLGRFIGKVEILIITGGARGVDALGARFARAHNLQLKVVPADWDAYGPSAGPRRNEQMARMAGFLIAFWDGKSRGTRNMIQTAYRFGLRVKVVYIHTTDGLQDVR